MNVPPVPPLTAPAARSQSDLQAAPWIALLLAILIAALRIVLFRSQSFCGTPDACFYLGLAQSLGSGHGFQTRFLYDLLQAHPTLPNTGIEYWRPGISLLLQLTRLFGGVTLGNSIIITTLTGCVLSAAAWHMAVHATGSYRLALGSFALCLVSSPLWLGSATPDSGLYYGAAVAWFLALFTVRSQGLLAEAIALLCICFAYLIRNDAALLLVPLLAVLWARRRVLPVDPAVTSPRYIALLLLGFVFALAPMHLLYRAVLGTPFPSGTAQVLFLTDFSDFSRYRSPVNVHTLLAHGARYLLTVRATTLATVLYRVAALMIGYPALILLPGLWVDQQAGQSRSGPPPLPVPEHVGPLSFAVAALAAYTLVLPAVGSFSALRTAVGLMPCISVLVAVAIQRATRSSALAMWIGSAVVAANAITGVMEVRRELPSTNQLAADLHDEAAQLDALGGHRPSSIVLTNDPVQFSVTTGYATIELPSNGLGALLDVAHDFPVTHVILDSTNLPAPLDVLKQELHPVRFFFLDREHRLVLQLPAAGIRR